MRLPQDLLMVEIVLKANSNQEIKESYKAKLRQRHFSLRGLKHQKEPAISEGMLAK